MCNNYWIHSRGSSTLQPLCILHDQLIDDDDIMDSCIIHETMPSAVMTATPLDVHVQDGISMAICPSIPLLNSRLIN
jgi:hypothetical protein